MACILEFVRVRVDPTDKTGQPMDRTWAGIHSLEGMKAVLRLMVPDEINPYLAPWKLTELGHDDEAIMNTLHHQALRNV